MSQIYTGFSLLAAKGKINLVQKLGNYSHHGKALMRDVGPYGLNGLYVVLNDSKVIYYDTSDASALQSEALAVADAYFKRSYVSRMVPPGYEARVHPLGFNYELYVGRLNRFEVSRFLFRRHLLQRSPREFCIRIAELLSFSFLPTIAKMSSPPILRQDPRVLFMARAWDPGGEGVELSAGQKQEREQINEARASCVALLRKELGARFYGGFARTKYAMENYRGLLLENVLVSGKEKYLALLQQFPICIATTGLYGSIGWKMAEYVAFSKAIVSEKLQCEVPGNFDSGKNYGEFHTAEQCLQETMKLVENEQSRQQMMQNNWTYYKNYLEPDQLILRTLGIASDC